MYAERNSSAALSPFCLNVLKTVKLLTHFADDKMCILHLFKIVSGTFFTRINI